MVLFAWERTPVCHTTRHKQPDPGAAEQRGGIRPARRELGAFSTLGISDSPAKGKGTSHRERRKGSALPAFLNCAAPVYIKQDTKCLPKLTEDL